MGNRYNYIDQMKGLAILLVVMGHTFIHLTSDKFQFPPTKIISSFHMSFFFFLSGYVLGITNKLKQEGTSKFLKNKFTSILVPYCFFLIVVPIFTENYFPVNFREFLRLFNFYPVGTHWFLPLLFIFMVIYAIRSEFIDNKSWRYDLISPEFLYQFES